MIGSDGEFEPELTRAMRRFAEQHRQLVASVVAPLADQQRQLVASVVAPLADQRRQLVISLASPLIAAFAEQQRQLVASVVAPLAEQHRQLAASLASPLVAAFAEQQRQAVIRYSEQVASVSADATLPSWVVQGCAFLLLAQVLFVGWSLAATVSPEARAKYIEIIGLVMIALQLSLMIKNGRGGNSDG